MASPASTDKDKFVISFFASEGYLQDGFHSDSTSDTEGTISAAWLVEENNILIEDHLLEQVSLPPSQPPEVQQPFSPSIFLVSYIEESELISDTDMTSPAIKRSNPEQQTYLHNSGIGSSSGPDYSRRVSTEEYEQWIDLYQPAKRFKPDSTDQPTCSPDTSHFNCSYNNASTGDKSSHTAPPAAPAISK